MIRSSVLAAAALLFVAACTPSSKPSDAPAATVSVKPLPPNATGAPVAAGTPAARGGGIAPVPNVTVVIGGADRAQHVTLSPVGLSFYVPNAQAGVSYTGAKLAEVRACRGEWDKEFAEVANAILPFEALAVHMGQEKFCEGAGYFDMHVRAYVLDGPAEAVVKQIKTRGAAEKQRLSNGESGRDLDLGIGQPSKWEPRVDFPDWTHVRISYPRFYGDYGGTAHVETFTRAFGSVTLVLVLMRTKSPVYEADGARVDPFASIVLSVTKS